MLKDLLLLLFPKSCNACYELLVLNENEICTNCRNELPIVSNESLTNLKGLFKEDIVITNFSSLFYFEKHSEVQELLHNLKYRNHLHIGELIGNWHAAILLKTESFQTIDLVIPIPIHKKRLRQRGYNQVALYAQTIAKKLNADYRDDILTKTAHKKSQVSLNKKERFNNILNSLTLNKPNDLEEKHILILDDIITTGATMSACVSYLKNKADKISIASIALVPNESL